MSEVTAMKGEFVPDSTRRRPSHEAVLPEDVTDPLLWRLAYDVAVVHRPDDSGRCGSPECADQPGPCAPWRNAQRGMELARAGASAVGRPERASGGPEDRFDQPPSGVAGHGSATDVFLPQRRPGSTLRAA